MPTTIAKPLQWGDYNRDHPITDDMLFLTALWAQHGPTAFDLANNKDATLFNDPEWVGEGVGMDGTNQAIQLTGFGVGANNALNGLTELSFACRVRFDTVAQDVDLIVEGNHQGGSKFLFWMDNAAPDHFNIIINGLGALTSTFIPLANTWYDLVLTFQGSTAIRLYINGVEDASSPWEAGIPASIGNTTGGNLWWLFNDEDLATKGLDGTAEYAALWSRAVLSAEASELHAKPYLLIEPPSTKAYFFFQAPVGGNRRRRLLICGAA